MTINLNRYSIMKKFFFLVLALAAISLVSCESEKKVDYKAEGTRLALQLDSLCALQDTAAVAAFEDSIRAREEAIFKTGDATGLDVFREALKEARHNASLLLTSARMEQGAKKEDAVQHVIMDALNGNVDLKTVTSAIDVANSADSVK